MPLASIPSPPRSVWHLGPLPFRAQELCVVAGIVLAIWITGRRYRTAGGPRGVILDVAAWAVPAGLVPAAIGVLLGQPHGSWQAVRTWDAVLGFPGALALGTLAAWLACRHLRPGRPGRPDRPGRSGGPDRSRDARLSGRPASGTSAAEPAENPAPATVAATAETASPSSPSPTSPTSPTSPSPLPSPVALTLDPAVRPARAAVLADGGRRLRFGPVAAAAAPAIAFGTAIAAIGSWFSQQGFGRPSALPWAVTIAPAHRPAGYENFATFQPIFLYQALWAVTAGIAIAVATRKLALRGDRALALYAAAYAAGGFALFWLGIGHLPVVLGLRAGELGDAAVLVGAAIYLVRTRPTRTKTLHPAHKPALESDSPVM
jgi:prolipoprotein diacylglyceryltransferase